MSQMNGKNNSFSGNTGHSQLTKNMGLQQQNMNNQQTGMGSAKGGFGNTQTMSNVFWLRKSKPEHNELGTA